MGVFVVASTLGSLEALTKFLEEDVKCPMVGFSLGTVHKKHVMKAEVILEERTVRAAPSAQRCQN